MERTSLSARFAPLLGATAAAVVLTVAAWLFITLGPLMAVAIVLGAIVATPAAVAAVHRLAEARDAARERRQPPPALPLNPRQFRRMPTIPPPYRARHSADPRVRAATAFARRWAGLPAAA